MEIVLAIGEGIAMGVGLAAIAAALVYVIYGVVVVIRWK